MNRNNLIVTCTMQSDARSSVAYMLRQLWPRDKIDRQQDVYMIRLFLLNISGCYELSSLFVLSLPIKKVNEPNLMKDVMRQWLSETFRM